MTLARAKSRGDIKKPFMSLEKHFDPVFTAALALREKLNVAQDAAAESKSRLTRLPEKWVLGLGQRASPTLRV